ncbi:MAG: hypothetical protein L6R39_005917 [Caloplaca ligustica]|nr:MAG: hypothetical protein L6R39_005917 [Caloplaca ligustica]
MAPSDSTDSPRGKSEQDTDPDARTGGDRFSPEEEAALLSDSHAEKAAANELFKSAQYSQAISTYDRALASVPNYLEYEIAVLKSNIAACHLKLSDWKAAIDEATKSIEALDRLEAPPFTTAKDEKSEDGAGDVSDAGNVPSNDDGVVELPDGDEDEAEALKKIEEKDQRHEDIKRIRTKALMRRARARSEQGGWSNLQGALEDYQTLSAFSSLPPPDTKVINTALRTLPPRINAAKEQEMGEMMGKLKELGNGILKPFGLSTDSFKFEKDEKTGGYSIGMNN